MMISKRSIAAALLASTILSSSVMASQKLNLTDDSQNQSVLTSNFGQGRFLTDPSQAIKKTVLDHVFEFGSNFLSNMGNTTISKLANMVTVGEAFYKKDFGPVGEEIIGAVLVKFFGNTNKHLFTVTTGEFDEETFNNAVSHFLNFVQENLKSFINKSNDKYVLDKDGNKLPIYNDQSLFKMLVQAFVPDTMLSRVLISLGDQDILKDYFQDKIQRTVISYLMQRAAHEGTSLRSQSLDVLASTYVQSKNVFNTLHSYVTDEVESSTNFSMPKEVWDYLEPRFLHFLRGMIDQTVETVSASVLRKFDHQLRDTTTTLSYPISGTMVYLVSCLTSWVHPMLLYPTLCPPFQGLAGGALYESLKEKSQKLGENALPSLIHKLLPVTPEEHVLYNLNPKPSEVERLLFGPDYSSREKPQQDSFLRAVSEMFLNWAERVLNEKLSLSNQVQSTADFAQNHLDQYDLFQKGIRKLAYLKLTNSKEYKKVLEDIKKYPSFEWKKAMLEGKDIPFFEMLGRAIEKVSKIQEAAQKIAGQLSDDFPNKDQLIEAVLGLSIIEQNAFIEMEGELTKEDKNSLSKHKSQVQDFEVTGDSVEDVRAAKMRAKVRALIQIHNQKMIGDYVDAHKEEIETLKNHSITENLTDLEIIKLHKRGLRVEELEQPQITTSGLKLDVSNLEDESQKQYAAQHEPELILIQKGYHRIMALHYAYVLHKIYIDNVKKNKILNQFAKIIDGNKKDKIDIEYIAKEIVKDSNEHKIFESSYAPIKEYLRDHNFPFQDDFDKYYDQLMKRLLYKWAQEVLDRVQGRFEENKPQDKSGYFSGVFPSFWSSTSSLSDEQNLSMEERLQKLDLHDPRDAQGFQLLEILEKMDDKMPLKMSSGDLIKIHKKIVEMKSREVGSEENKFYKKYKDELVDFRNKSDFYKNRLFYGWPELIKGLRRQNQERIKRIFQGKGGH